jgi:tetratricopeptide (TPR) repeat protein
MGTTCLLSVALAVSGCALSPEAKSAKHIEAGKKLLEKKDATRAILEFRNASQATPRNPEAHYQLGLGYLAAGDLARGLASLRKALELNPKHAGAQLRLASLMAGANDAAWVKEAQQRLQALLQESPENTEALHALAVTELKLGEPKNAMQHLEQALLAAPQEILNAVLVAEAKLHYHDVKGAEDVLKKAVENAPKSDEARVALGKLYASENKLALAEEQFRQALALNANSVPALFSLAALQNSTGRKQEAEESFKRLSTLPDKSSKHFHALFLFEEGRRDEAIKELAALAAQDPNDRTARTRLVAAFQAVNRMPDALGILNAALKKNPKDMDALLQRGELEIGSGKYAEAEADLNQVLHLRPDSAEVHFALGTLYERRGVALRQRQELSEALRLNPLFLQARIEMAKALIADNTADSLKAALSLLDSAPEAQKSIMVITEQRNWALISAGRLDEARQGVNQALPSARNPDLLLQDAMLKISAGRFADARQVLHEELSKYPDDLRGLRILVASYVAQKQVPAAVEQVRAHAAQNPKSAPVQFFLGSLLTEVGKKDEAKQAFAAAKMANPEYTAADLSVVQINLNQANWDDARKELGAILAKNEIPLARKWLGMLEQTVGNQTAAIANFRRVIEVEPNNVVALNNLAFLLSEQGQHNDEALKYAERAVELAPDNGAIEDTLGWVLYKKGLYSNAVTHLQASVSKSKGPGALQYYHLAMAYFKAGDHGKGKAALQSGLLKDPNLPEAKLAQQMAP